MSAITIALVAAVSFFIATLFYSIFKVAEE